MTQTRNLPVQSILLLSGGGAMCAFQVPIVEALINRAPYDLIIGSGTGAVNAMFAAQGRIGHAWEWWRDQPARKDPKRGATAELDASPALISALGIASFSNGSYNVRIFGTPSPDIVTTLGAVPGDIKRVVPAIPDKLITPSLKHIDVVSIGIAEPALQENVAAWTVDMALANAKKLEIEQEDWAPAEGVRPVVIEYGPTRQDSLGSSSDWSLKAIQQRFVMGRRFLGRPVRRDVGHA